MNPTLKWSLPRYKCKEAVTKESDTIHGPNVGISARRALEEEQQQAAEKLKKARSEAQARRNRQIAAEFREADEQRQRELEEERQPQTQVFNSSLREYLRNRDRLVPKRSER